MRIWSAHVGRHDPQVERARRALSGVRGGHAQGFLSIRRPARHVERVRDDARARLQLGNEARLQLPEKLGKQVDRDDGGLGNIGLERVVVDEPDLVGDPCRARVLAGPGDEAGVVIDAEAACAEAARRGDDDATVAGAEVDHEVLRPRPGEDEHALDDVLRGGDEGRAQIGILRAGRACTRAGSNNDKDAASHAHHSSA
jgi:hypothetical protein